MAVLLVWVDVYVLKFLEFIKVIRPPRLIHNLLIVLIRQLGIINSIGPLNTLSDILIQLGQELLLRLLFTLSDQTRMRFQQQKWL